MRAKLLCVAVLAALLATVGCHAQDDDGPASPPSEAAVLPLPKVPLNVMVVVIDDGSDVSCAQMNRYFPKISRVLRDRGTCFENATVTSPACCPSRAVLQTGQFGHNNTVKRQIDAGKLRVEDTVQDQLSEAGYDTYGTGKFFNGISPWLFESGERSSGFLSSDFWASSKYYDYVLWDDEAQKPRKPADRVHATTRAGTFVRDFIADRDDQTRPFYTYVAFKAPHTDNSAPNKALRFPRPTPANANRAVPPFRWNPETQKRDKLPIFQHRIASRKYYAKLYAARTRAQYDVDDEMGKTFDLLEAKGLLDTTAIFFTSDNGYHLGENGWETKGDPYQASMDVPLLAYLPGTFGAGKVDSRPVGLIDIAPTVYDLLGLEPQNLLDGHSLLSSKRRKGTFFELQNEKSRVLYKEAGYAPGLVPTWSMYREGKRSYIEFYDKDDRVIRSEYYVDKENKRNLLWRGSTLQRPSPRVLAHFRERLRRGRTCAGTASQGSANPCP
ncbi:sulfatase-like hydrolase/transferase [Nocardioides sp.]|uniref:sulfatase-like hydrolase/transferase n=1 Tax=Nocardioides sp. TaxID=35761 RepID=UPI00272653BF|nr:sulfatase-like hydrolase/transferase [Nocardioides sp.]MDO9457897.1 sulfatase-like hydrolase/transferase [Nocardioides sp.]